jgi:hypothetical protein
MNKLIKAYMVFITILATGGILRVAIALITGNIK